MISDVNPVLIEVPVPIRTPRLTLRPKQPGDGRATAKAVEETWDDLHRWMAWAEHIEDHTAEQQEVRTRQVMAKLTLREEINLLGIEIATGQPVVWCGLHSIDWKARLCETGYWVRKTAQGRGFATEATNALLRYGFGALHMRRVGISHAAGNEASRRVVVKLGFSAEGIQRQATLLPGGLLADRVCYARFDTVGLPPLKVQWGFADFDHSLSDSVLSAHLRSLEERLLDPKIRAQPDLVAGLLTDDFREFGSSGRLFTKQQILSELAQEVTRSHHLSDYFCDRLTPTTALVTYRSHRTEEQGIITSARRSSIWVLRENHWKLHFHQGTRE